MSHTRMCCNSVDRGDAIRFLARAKTSPIGASGSSRCISLQRALHPNRISRSNCVSVQLCLAVKGKPLRCIVYITWHVDPRLSGGLPEDYQRILLLPDNTV